MVLWCGEGSGVLELGREEHKVDAALWVRRAGRPRGSLMGDMDRAREVWGRGVWRTEERVWSGSVLWRSHAGTGTGARSLAPPAATAHTVFLGGSFWVLEAERLESWGEQRSGCRLIT